METLQYLLPTRREGESQRELVPWQGVISSGKLARPKKNISLESKDV